GVGARVQRVHHYAEVSDWATITPLEKMEDELVSLKTTRRFRKSYLIGGPRARNLRDFHCADWNTRVRNANRAPDDCVPERSRESCSVQICDATYTSAV